jgi:hypothetical protein
VPRGGLRTGAGRPKGSKDKPKVDGIFDDGPKESNLGIKESNPCNEGEAETYVCETGNVVALVRNPRLATLKDVRLEMAYIYKRMENRIIEVADGSRLIYSLRQIGDIITMSEFEERIELLEERHQELLQDRQRALPATYGNS